MYNIDMTVFLTANTQRHCTQRTIKAFHLIAEPLPEDPEDIPHILKHVAECSITAIHPTPEESLPHWPTEFFPAQTHCVLCSSELTSPRHVPGSNGKSYLLHRMGMIPVVALMKRCTNVQCNTRYIYNTWREGIEY